MSPLLFPNLQEQFDTLEAEFIVSVSSQSSLYSAFTQELNTLSNRCFASKWLRKASYLKVMVRLHLIVYSFVRCPESVNAQVELLFFHDLCHARFAVSVTTGAETRNALPLHHVEEDALVLAWRYWHLPLKGALNVGHSLGSVSEAAAHCGHMFVTFLLYFHDSNPLYPV